MKFLKPLFIKLSFIIFASQAMGQPIENLSQFEFMLGKWSAEFPHGAFYEEWTKESDTKFTGMAYTIKDGDSTPSETLSLELIDDGYRQGVYYIAIPVLQDTTFFKFSTGTDQDAEFLNPDHDFPQRIAYKRVDADRLFAVVDNLDENSKTLEFNFIRVKEEDEE